jgi:hypothetical protein
VDAAAPQKLKLLSPFSFKGEGKKAEKGKEEEVFRRVFRRK